MQNVLSRLEKLQQAQDTNGNLNDIYQSISSINNTIFVRHHDKDNNNLNNNVGVSMTEKLEKMTSDEFDSIMNELDSNKRDIINDVTVQSDYMSNKKETETKMDDGQLVRLFFSFLFQFFFANIFVFAPKSNTTETIFNPKILR